MQPSPGRPRWLRVAVLVPIQLAWVLLFVGGLRVMALGSGPLGVVLLVGAAITGYLSLRRLADAIRTSTDIDPGELRGPAFDYIIWTAIGFPIFIVVALLIAVLLGGGR